MKVRFFRSALDDLANARRFYDRQQEGVGDYFFGQLISLRWRFPLALHGEFTPCTSACIVCWQSVFRFPVYYRMIEGEAGLYFAVLDCRRYPEWVRRALSLIRRLSSCIRERSGLSKGGGAKA